MAYFKLNVDYIIETYCVNKEKPKLQCKGKCHLAKELSLETPQNNEGASNSSRLYQAFFPVFFKPYKVSNSLVFVVAIFENNWHYAHKAYRLFQEHLDPPPQYLI